MQLCCALMLDGRDVDVKQTTVALSQVLVKLSRALSRDEKEKDLTDMLNGTTRKIQTMADLKQEGVCKISAPRMQV